MKLSAEAITMIEESQNQEKLKQVIALVEERLAEYAIEPTELQWTILINHLNEMLKRSQKEKRYPLLIGNCSKKYPKKLSRFLMKSFERLVI